MVRRVLLSVLLSSVALSAQSSNLDIYWIDTEGGAATLIVAPGGQSLLVDTGNPGPDDRDAKRVFQVIQQAGVKKIDSLVITHFHGDHVGGAPALAKMIPIDHFCDHGDSIEAQVRAVVRYGRRTRLRRLESGQSSSPAINCP